MRHHKLRLSVLIVCALAHEGAFAEYATNYASVDVSQWKCLLCEFESYSATTGQFSVASVLTTNDSDRFGRNGSFERAGTRSVLDAQLKASGTAGWVVNASASDIGLESYDLALAFKNGRSIEAQLKFQQYRRLLESDALTPFRVTNGGLTLDSDWQRDSQTHGFTSLATTNRHIVLGTTRRLLESTISIDLMPRINLVLGHIAASKEGMQETYRDGILQSTALPKTIDQESATNRVQLTYQDDRSIAAWSRTRSTFTNSKPVLRWESPYRFGVSENESANKLSHQHFSETFDIRFSLLGNSLLRFRERRGESEIQPQSMRYGLGPLLHDVEAIQLFAKREYRSRRLAFTTQFPRDIDVSISRSIYQFDDLRPTEALTPALGGSFLTQPRALRPGDFSRRESELGLTYLPNSGLRVLTTFWLSVLARTDQEIAENEEQGIQLKLTQPIYDRWSAFSTIQREMRTASMFAAVTANNPNTRRYHQAKLERQIWSGGLRYSVPENNDFVSITVDVERLNYPDSVLGLTNKVLKGISIASALELGEQVVAHGYVASHRQHTTIKGSQSLDLSMPWQYSPDDAVTSAGLNFAVHPINDQIEHLSIDYTLSDGQAKLTTLFSNETSAFPDQISRHESLEFSVGLDEIYGTTIEASVYVEEYEASDWAIDDVVQVTLDQVLTLGRDQPSYRNVLFSIELKRVF